MKIHELSFVLTLIITFFLITNTYQGSTYMNYHSRAEIVEENMIEVSIRLTSPGGYVISNRTSVIITLGDIAAALTSSVDSFGNTTTTEIDDIKWEATYLYHQGTALPVQIDDIDSQNGYSEDDELVFQIPESLVIQSGDSVVFSLYIATNDVDFPVPEYTETCRVYDYSRKEEVQQQHGVDMLNETYYIENGVIRSCALVEAAWSSGGIYELSILETGWDIIKMNYDFDWEIWKWTRFALIEQFIETNQNAYTNPFYTTRIISGPVRAQMQMRTTAPYGKPGSSWGQLPGVYGQVTYEMYADQPWLDYTLDIVGENASNYEELPILFMNRDFGGGMMSTHHSVYIPGVGYRDRNPDSTDDQYIQNTQFSAPWLIEKIPPAGEYKDLSDEPYFDDWSLDDFKKAGYGMIFDDTGFSNATWNTNNEWVRLWFDAMQFPFHARYLPFDKSITSNGITHVSDHYNQLWTLPTPEIVITAQAVTSLPSGITTAASTTDTSSSSPESEFSTPGFSLVLTITATGVIVFSRKKKHP